MFSASECAYAIHSSENKLRLDGRDLSGVRAIEVQVGLIAQATGSARVRLGATDVIVGLKVSFSPAFSVCYAQNRDRDQCCRAVPHVPVQYCLPVPHAQPQCKHGAAALIDACTGSCCALMQAEVGSSHRDDPNCGRLFVSVECSPCASPQFEARDEPCMCNEFLGMPRQSYSIGTAAAPAGTGRGGLGPAPCNHTRSWALARTRLLRWARWVISDHAASSITHRMCLSHLHPIFYHLLSTHQCLAIRISMCACHAHLYPCCAEDHSCQWPFMTTLPKLLLRCVLQLLACFGALASSLGKQRGPCTWMPWC